MSSCLTKIVGGCSVEQGELPWLCGLLHDEVLVCGASLIQNQPGVVVTAAHCLSDTR